MSFYNADPRAYFEWYDKKWNQVWDGSKWTIDNLEVGRLVRIQNDENSSANNNYKIYIVSFDSKNNKKILKEFPLINPNCFALGTDAVAEENQMVIGTYSQDDEDALFIVGKSTDDDHYPNGLEVRKDGTLYVPLINEAEAENPPLNAELKVKRIQTSDPQTQQTQIKDVLFINGIPQGNTNIYVNSHIQVDNVDDDGIKIATLQDTETDSDLPNCTITLPRNITKDITINNGFELQTNKITSTTDGQSTQIGKTVGNVTSGLKFGDYEIQIVNTMSDVSDVRNDTLYIVLDEEENTSSS